ncbi:MAG: RHS repeat-associated core domain-containing protein, partial [Bryobacterales bacterium]|nr:RHS repeat-associated core domain-containing protein [Bryobacterales bacterium]
AAEYANVNPVELGTTYYSRDSLGSTRVVSGAGGTVRRRIDYWPFGEEVSGLDRGSYPGYGGNVYPGARGMVDEKFTGKERDAETGLDYFGARYMSAVQGRFSSPDPLPGWQKDPQSWNMYAYGRNNPLKYVDPTGETYRVCDAKEENCANISDAEFEKFRKDNKDLNFRGGSAGSIYAGRTLSGTFTQTDVDIDPGVAMVLYAAGVTADREVKNFARAILITAATGPLLGTAAGTLTKITANLPLLRQVSRLVSNNTFKHLVNRGHVADFQKLDPTLTVDGVIKIGIEVAETGSQVAGNAFVKAVQVGGKEVTVRSVLNSNNAIRTVHILE